MSKLSDNIKNLRRFRSLTQKDLAKKLNVSVATLSNWERGSDNFGISMLFLMCEVLDVTPNQLCGWEQCPGLNEFLREEAEQQKIKAEQALSNISSELSNLIEKLNSINDTSNTDNK